MKKIIDDVDILAMYNSGKSAAAIAAKHKISMTTVYRKVEEAGKKTTSAASTRGRLNVVHETPFRAPNLKKFDLAPGDRVKAMNHILGERQKMVVEKVYPHIFLVRSEESIYTAAFPKVDFQIGQVVRVDACAPKEPSTVETREQPLDSASSIAAT